MGRLVYAALTSLDGYVADQQGNFGWAAPDEEVHARVNELESKAGTCLYGRRLYEVMVAWETMTGEGEPAVIREFGEHWRAQDKVVFSTTLKEVSSARTRIERSFDPETVRQMKVSAEQDITIGGPALASAAIEAGLVDDYHLFIAPVVVGGGNPWLTHDVRLDLDLVEERRFASGFVHLHYRPRG